MSENTTTMTTEVPVPYAWLASFYPNVSTSYYETLAAQRGANGYFVWESYVAGLDPTDSRSTFKAVISFENNEPVVGYEPVLPATEAAKRKYTVYGKTRLTNASWTKVSPGTERNYRFFKVSVEMK